MSAAYVFDIIFGVQVDLQQLVDAFGDVEGDHERDGQRHEDPDGVLALVAETLHEGFALGEQQRTSWLKIEMQNMEVSS